MSSKVPLGRLSFSLLLKTTSPQKRKRAENLKIQWLPWYLHTTDLSKKAILMPCLKFQLTTMKNLNVKKIWTKKKV